MGIKERREGEKAELKKKIMDATIEIINQEGYENLSIRKIATKIEYSPTTIYLYYRDKAEIISDMLDGLYGKIVDDAVAILNQDASVSLDQKIHDILCGVIKSLSDEPEMSKAILYGGMNKIFTSEDKNPYPTNSGIHMLDQLFTKGIAENVVKPSIQNSSWMVISALLGFAMTAVENKIYLLPHYEQIVKDFVAILMGGVKQ